MKNKGILNKTPILGKTSRKELSDEKRIGKVKNELNQNVDLKQTLYTPSYLNTEDTGRSMIEMLGTLAVIGVLSVAGITGYRYAMDKWYSNDIVNEVNLRATDIRNRYQEIPLPDTDSEKETDFPEYTDRTSTGFPIYVKSFPDVAYKIIVDEVPSGVCKQVLNMNLNNNIAGLQYVQVNDVKYENSVTVCDESETNNQLIFTSFLDSENRNIEHCVEDADCSSCCGIAECDAETLTCKNYCNDWDRPFCLCNEDKTDGMCVQCLTDNDCPGDDNICDPSNYQCVTIPKKCEANQFRSKNGACIPCTYMSSIVVMNADDNSGIFEKEAAGKIYKDDTSGIAQCEACSNSSGIKHRVVEIESEGEKTTYCAVNCVKGKEYISSANGCVSCDSPKELDIQSDAQALQFCTACSNRIWFKTPYSNYKCVLKDCPEGQVKRNGVCGYCDTSRYGWPSNYDFYAAVIWQDNGTWSTSAGSMKEAWSDTCRRCPEVTTGRKQGTRTPVYTQEYKQTICAISCEKEKGLLSFEGICFPCEYDNAVEISMNARDFRKYLNDSCTACGRTVLDGYCLKSVSNCSDDEEGNKYIRDIYGQCVRCDTDTKEIPIGKSQKSACEGKCNRTATSAYGGVVWRCTKKCADTGEYLRWGTCYACNTIGNGTQISSDSTRANDYMLTLCRNCGDYEFAGVPATGYCVPKTCSQDYFKASTGFCTDCSSSTTSIKVSSETACQTCSNRIYVNGYCVKYNPGVSGVCNNDGTDKFQNYPSGEGKYYRDNTGICRKCADSSTSYDATQSECASCGGIRYLSGSKCQYGGCEEGSTFLSIQSNYQGCQSCTISLNKVAVPESAESETLCNSCNRRIMTDSSGNYCVVKCSSGEWQDINGDCHDGLLSSSINEIGTDDISQELCIRAGRKVTRDEYGQFYCDEE